VRHARPLARVAYTAIGVLGELLITLGLFLLAFLAWQLWWTDVEANRAQAQILDELVPAPLSTQVAVPGEGDPPVMAAPALRETFAALHVPRWEGDPPRPISEGTDRATVLDVLGLGHYVGTAMPGEIGNFAVAGHRTTYGRPFHRVEELGIGDPLVVWTQDTWYVYRVTSTLIVMPNQVDVIAPVPGDPTAVPTERMITLTTCHPMFSARERFIVHGVFEYWAPTSTGTPAELLGR